MMLKKIIIVIFVFGLTLLIPVPVFAGDGNTVSMEEFNRLKTDYEQLKGEVKELKQLLGGQRQVAKEPAVSEDKYVSVEEFEALKEQVEEVRPGLTSFALTGYGFSSFTDTEGGDSNFTAGLNPIFLWKLSDKVFFEGELELELEDGGTAVGLEYADVSYFLNDYMTLGAGKFLSPFGIFRERLHPKWINKLPNQPLGYASGASRLAPEAQIGAQVRGGIPLIGDSKMGYTLYASNGPTLETSATKAGQLAFKNTDDTNSNKAFGGRIGFLPIPELEVGYSWETSRPGARDTAFHGVNALLQEVDLSYIRDSDLIKGVIDLRSEWIWSKVDSVDYGTTGGAFKNDRWSRYLQAAYRPSKVNHSILKNLEFVFRFDQIDQPSKAPTSIDRKRYTEGLNYWINPSTVAKLAYQSDAQDEGGTNQHSLMAEMAVGF